MEVGLLDLVAPRLLKQMTNDISSQLLHCTVRIDTDDGSGNGLSGTGFFVSYSNDRRPTAFLVTNRHIAINAERARLAFLKRNGSNPIIPSREVIKIENFAKKFTYHDNPSIDVAVMPFGQTVLEREMQGIKIFYKTIPTTMFLNPQLLESLSAIEDIIFVGYPRMLHDNHSLSPITRQGITATPISQDFEGMPMFLIDGSIFEGSSGSPVFILNRGMYRTQTEFAVGNRTIFLGVLAKLISKGNTGLTRRSDARSLSLTTHLTDMFKNSPNLTPYINIGLVFKYESIIDVIKKTYRNLNIEPP